MKMNDLLLLFARIDSFQSIKNGSLRFSIKTKNKINSYDDDDGDYEYNNDDVYICIYTYNIMSLDT